MALKPAWLVSVRSGEPVAGVSTWKSWKEAGARLVRTCERHNRQQVTDTHRGGVSRKDCGACSCSQGLSLCLLRGFGCLRVWHSWIISTPRTCCCVHFLSSHTMKVVSERVQCLDCCAEHQERLTLRVSWPPDAAPADASSSALPLRDLPAWTAAAAAVEVLPGWPSCIWMVSSSRSCCQSSQSAWMPASSPLALSLHTAQHNKIDVAKRQHDHGHACWYILRAPVVSAGQHKSNACELCGSKSTAKGCWELQQGYKRTATKPHTPVPALPQSAAFFPAFQVQIIFIVSFRVF